MGSCQSFSDFSSLGNRLGMILHFCSFQGVCGRFEDQRSRAGPLRQEGLGAWYRHGLLQRGSHHPLRGAGRLGSPLLSLCILTFLFAYLKLNRGRFCCGGFVRWTAGTGPSTGTRSPWMKTPSLMCQSRSIRPRDTALLWVTRPTTPLRPTANTTRTYKPAPSCWFLSVFRDLIPYNT